MRTHRGGILLATVFCLLAPGSVAAQRLAPDAEVRSIFLAGSGKECLDLAVTQDTEVSSPSGIRVTVTGRNHCSEDIDGNRSRFKVTALGTGGAEIATQSGRFGGTVAAQGRVETRVFLVCDPERVRSLRVEAQ